MALKTQASLKTIAKGKGPFSPSKLKQLRAWVSDDRESHELAPPPVGRCDRDAVKVIVRLLQTVSFFYDKWVKTL